MGGGSGPEAPSAAPAVLGGWDPSARRFFETDELSFSLSWGMFEQMLTRFGDSFLTTKTWSVVRKKIARSPAGRTSRQGCSSGGGIGCCLMPETAR